MNISCIRIVGSFETVYFLFCHYTICFLSFGHKEESFYVFPFDPFREEDSDCINAISDSFIDIGYISVYIAA